MTLAVVYAERRKLALYAECHYAECHYAECLGAHLLILNIDTNLLDVREFQMHFFHCIYAEKLQFRIIY